MMQIVSNEEYKKYYTYVDEIILGIDKDRITWSGNELLLSMKQ